VTGEPAPHRFEDETIDAICRYMKQEQPRSCAHIVQHATGDPVLRPAELVTFDGRCATFDLPGEHQRVIVDWAHPISTRGEVRQQLVQLLEAAIGM
jgi:hypothetical protein